MINFKDYTKQTQKTMKQITNFLIGKYGEIQPQWEMTLIMIADNLDLLKECQESIKLNGIYSAVRGVKNPLISTIKDINATLLKLNQQLGLTPWADSKIKGTNEETTDDFIEALTN